MSIPKRVTVILISLAFGTFLFTCLMRMGAWNPVAITSSLLLVVGNLTPFALLAWPPPNLRTSKVFHFLHTILFLALATFMTYVAYDLTYVNVDALNAIAFLTLPVMTLLLIAAFYGLSRLISLIPRKTPDPVPDDAPNAPR